MFDAKTMKAAETPPPPRREFWLVMAYHAPMKFWSIRPGGPYQSREEAEQAAARLASVWRHAHLVRIPAPKV